MAQLVRQASSSRHANFKHERFRGHRSGLIASECLNEDGGSIAECNAGIKSFENVFAFLFLLPVTYTKNNIHMDMDHRRLPMGTSVGIRNRLAARCQGFL